MPTKDTSQEKPTYIVRAPHSVDDKYFMISRDSAQDERLSYEARGVLAYLLSKPKDWRVQITDIAIESCGRDKARRILKELETFCYLTPPQRKNSGDGKQFEWTPYIVYERPEDNPLTDKPSTANQSMDKPDMGNQGIYRRQSKQKKETKKDIASATPDALPAKTTTPATTINPIKDAIAVAFGWQWDKMTHTERVLTGKAAKELASAGVKPEQVILLYRECIALGWKGFKPMALCGLVSTVLKFTPDIITPIVAGNAERSSLDSIYNDNPFEGERNGNAK